MSIVYISGIWNLTTTLLTINELQTRRLLKQNL